MKFNIFDVVELENKEQAIIIEELNKTEYKAKIVNNKQEITKVINSKNVREILSKSNIHIW